MGIVLFVSILSLIQNPGHATKDCTNNRVFDLSSIADATAEVAWDNLQRADAKKDLDEIREVGSSKAVLHCDL